ncbi:hypothetical protein CEXT_501851 [Caerostris extrusa]|uniref:Uncharacterized protein n=1 Tax=Caerostris extrusa TaxID=172846 RepID=A0AAV4T3I5_CAEEX|nr:hypothetical protein CEXT_501851 [Caerostris extrusa]
MITTKCASILYSMVESCFQQEFLKEWNRNNSSTVSIDAKEWLIKFMTFRKTEIEKEEKPLRKEEEKLIYRVPLAGNFNK